MIAKILGSALGRWVTLGVVASLLSGAGYIWHRHNENLREEGATECVQEINKATLVALEDALADAESANADLRASLVAAAAANAQALARRQEAETQVLTLQEQMERQKNEDPTYREWSDTALPSSVADRLRQAAGSSSGHDN